MPHKLSIAIIGPGRLGSSLAEALVRVGYQVDEIVFRGASAARARALARRLHSRAVTIDSAKLSADVLWLCVGDREIRSVADQIAARTTVKGKFAFHSSGALSSRELLPLRQGGVAVASVHPLMSFVHASTDATFRVPFAVEGDARAVRVARTIVRDLKGGTLKISAAKKPLYHAFGAFVSPLVIAHLALAEKIGTKAGIPKTSVRQAMAPILATTIANYLRLGPEASLSGPLVRGDVETVRKNLAALKAVPEAQAVYRALAGAALRNLPVDKRTELERVIAAKKH